MMHPSLRRIKGVEGRGVYEAGPFLRLNTVDRQAFGIAYGAKNILVLPTLQPREDFPDTISKRYNEQDIRYLLGNLEFGGSGNLNLSDVGLDGNLAALLKKLETGRLWNKTMRFWFETGGDNRYPTDKKEYALILPHFAFTFGDDPKHLTEGAAIFLPFNAKYPRPKHSQSYRIA